MSATKTTQYMPYQHCSESGGVIDLPIGKVVCVGRNYLDHIQEMNNQVSEVALLFMKPSTSIVDMRDTIVIPSEQGECHNELEVALLVGQKLSKASIEQASASVCGIGLGLDLTLRDEQQRLKTAGQPWERAKSFDGSCPLSPFVSVDALTPDMQFKFTLSVNNRAVQNGDTTLMLRPMLELLTEISQYFTLLPGDVVLTGTPKGVGPLYAGDDISATLQGYFCISSQVCTPVQSSAAVQSSASVKSTKFSNTTPATGKTSS